MLSRAPSACQAESSRNTVRSESSTMGPRTASAFSSLTTTRVIGATIQPMPEAESRKLVIRESAEGVYSRAVQFVQLGRYRPEIGHEGSWPSGVGADLSVMLITRAPQRTARLRLRNGAVDLSAFNNDDFIIRQARPMRGAGHRETCYSRRASRKSIPARRSLITVHGAIQPHPQEPPGVCQRDRPIIADLARPPDYST